MELLSKEDREYLQNLFKNFQNDVNVIFFATDNDKKCEQCDNIRQILKELKDLSPKLIMTEYSFENDKDKAEEMDIEMAPAMVIMGEKYNGVKFYGVPSGYEFSSLVEDINDVGTGQSGLEDAVLEKLKKVNKPVHIKVFVTPTCPYCPAAVRTAHKFAMNSEHIKADMIESYEFDEVASKYDVHGVPKVIVNEDSSFEGALPDEKYLDEILKAIGE